MVLMHLRLIDRSFVPQNLISTQESPVPLLKFQMVPRLKVLMASGSKKGTQIYFSFLSESRPTNPFQVPNRVPMEMEACLQGILHISQKPHLLGSPVKEPSVKGTLTESLTEMPHHYSPPSFIYRSPWYMSPSPQHTRFP